MHAAIVVLAAAFDDRGRPARLYFNNGVGDFDPVSGPGLGGMALVPPLVTSMSPPAVTLPTIAAPAAVTVTSFVALDVPQRCDHTERLVTRGG